MAAALVGALLGLRKMLLPRTALSMVVVSPAALPMTTPLKLLVMTLPWPALVPPMRLFWAPPLRVTPAPVPTPLPRLRVPLGSVPIKLALHQVGEGRDRRRSDQDAARSVGADDVRRPCAADQVVVGAAIQLDAVEVAGRRQVVAVIDQALERGGGIEHANQVVLDGGFNDGGVGVRADTSMPVPFSAMVFPWPAPVPPMMIPRAPLSTSMPSPVLPRLKRVAPLLL